MFIGMRICVCVGIENINSSSILFLFLRVSSVLITSLGLNHSHVSQPSFSKFSRASGLQETRRAEYMAELVNPQDPGFDGH